MNLKQLTKATHTNNLIITDNTILHLVPEFGHSSFEYIYTSGIMLNNCAGIVVKTGNFKIGTKTINGRKIFLTTKEALTKDPDKSKNLNVFPTIPKKINDKQFLLIDHTVTSGIVQYITNMTNPRRGMETLINELKNEFQYLKSIFPNYNNNIVFLLGPNKPEVGIADLLMKIPTLDKDEFKLNIFDRTAMVNFKLTGGSPVIFSIAGFDKDGKVETYNNNIRSIPELYSATEKKIVPIDSTLTNPDSITGAAKDNKITHLAKSAEQTHLKLDDGEVKTLVNSDQLNKILKKYKVQDDSIANNIKHSLDNYLNKNGNKDNKEVNQEELESTVLKAIHQSVFGTSKIHDQYLDNPGQLFSKLQEANTYSKAMSYPEPKGDNLVKQEDVIDLKKVSGLVRQEYEFSDNIHEQVKELFKSLEDRKLNPVKIKNIKYKYEDDDLNRVINYEITIQNLTGGEKKPYTVHVKIPSLVNERYFKLNGKSYILSNQQIFTPVTKTDSSEVRLISSFSTSTFSVVNMRFNLSETSSIIEYISSHYPELIVNIKMDNGKVSSAQLKGDIFVDLIGSPAYTDANQALILDENGDWVVKAGEESHVLTTGKSEYLFDRLIDIISKINPEEKLHKTTKSLPYLQAYIGDTKLPLILYLWQQLGLINALTKLGIDFEIETVGMGIPLPLSGKETLFIHPKNKRQELIANGLFLLEKNMTMKFSKDEINNPSILDEYLETKYGKGTIYRLNLNAQNMIDPITKNLLEFQDKPTNQINLIIEDIIPKLLNDEPDKLTDLKIYRNRQAEIMFNLLYKNLMMAHNRYSNEIKFGNEDAKMFLRDNYVIECLLGIDPHSKGNSVVQLTQPYSPVTELKEAAKCIKSGPSGIPNKRSFKASHRNVHESYIGNIGANATSEYAEVGLVNHLVLNPMLSNKYGSYGKVEIGSETSGYDLVSLDEGLVPFISGIDADRAVLAYTHRGQVTPIVNGQVPIVATGVESVVAQLASNRFCVRAEMDGEVLEVDPDNYVKVKYKNGKINFIDITPRLSTTKRASYISLTMNTLQVGNKFVKDQLIAWTKNFDGNAYCSGRNTIMAVMNYVGLSHEDGYVITESMKNQYEVETVKEVQAFIPLNAKIMNIITKVGTDVPQGDSLLEFQYMEGNLDDYIEKFNLLADVEEDFDIPQDEDYLDNQDDQSSLYKQESNNIKIVSPGGKITQIRIYVNNITSVDPSVNKLYKEIVSGLKDKLKKYQSNVVTEKDKLSATDNLDLSQIKTGSHKYKGKLYEGARIVFYIEQTKTLNQGDKLGNRYGGKGVISHVIPDEINPKGEYSGKIDCFLSALSILGRKNTVVLKELYLGKILYNLPNILASKTAKVNGSLKSIRELIISIYSQLDTTKDKRLTKSVQDTLLSYTDIQLKKLLVNKELKLNYIVPPFTQLNFDVIKEVSDQLEIPLDERVFIPETNTWTKNKVPVGIQYMSTMEQLASDYESLRSEGGYTSITGQPLKGKSNRGGQSVGNMDVYNLLSYDTPSVIEELMTIRSDDFSGKREVISSIQENGYSDMPPITGRGATKRLHDIYVIALGLKEESIR